MEMLIRVVSKVNLKNAEANAGLLKAGDTVVIEEDDHPWTERERTNPEWRIVRRPGIRKNSVEARSLLEEDDPDAVADRNNGVRRRRKFNIAAAAIPSRKRQDLADTRRSAAIIVIDNPPEETTEEKPRAVKRSERAQDRGGFASGFDNLGLV